MINMIKYIRTIITKFLEETTVVWTSLPQTTFSL
jgi:hypothetical protein